ncbi:hypothetical protein E2562_009284 [Oryza meyeriana var. granulata]|uniref:30S ribosomal protein S16, chloroplastic n=1 Tax=Oryza meyeriana var. granulata TaxID=110450 RepID=A0A6G1EC85_9ORYZ|nr:hypothetical protein E2562_009284 [Oryza meyeriana var. granulata]
MPARVLGLRLARRGATKLRASAGTISSPAGLGRCKAELEARPSWRQLWRWDGGASGFAGVGKQGGEGSQTVSPGTRWGLQKTGRRWRFHSAARKRWDATGLRITGDLQRGIGDATALCWF